MKKRILLLGFLGILCSSIYAQQRTIDIQSPDGKLKVVVDLKEKLYYSVISQNDTILKNCTLSMTLSNDILGRQPHLQSFKKGK